MIDNKLKNIIKDYQGLPNAPFFQKYTSKYIKSILDASNIKYEENDYTILVRPKKPSNKKKLLIMSHTDHPGIIFSGGSKGQILGLIGTDNIIKYLRKNDIKVKVFDTNGLFLGSASVLNIVPGPKQEIEVKAAFDIPRNSIGMFDVASFNETKSTFELYNADNGIMASILLYLLSNNSLGFVYDVYAAFIKHEEVHQVSSWWLAKSNYISLTDKDYVLNLECLKTESIDVEKYGTIDYSSGLVLQLSNTGCLFGYKNAGVNDLELKIRQVATNQGLNLQIGLIKDSCDSRPFTHFALTPHVCTLTIPNKYKHNGADDGIIRTEDIKKVDIETCLSILTYLTNMELAVDTSLISTSERLKLKGAITDEKLMSRKGLLNRRLEIAYLAILKRGYFYPENILDTFKDFLLKGLSYFYYYFLKIITG